MRLLDIRGATIAALLLAPMAAHAAVPTRAIPFSAVLSSAAGVRQTGSFSVTLSLYNAASGGVPLWSEVQTVTATNGLFSTTLGKVTPFPASLNFSEAYYVGVKVGADAEMTPRVVLASVPYALALNLPYDAQGSDANFLLSMTNSGVGVGLKGVHSATAGTAPGVRGETNSQDFSAVGVLGVVTSTSPGSNSAGVQGINNGTGDFGIGVYGTHAGSGYGVYGSSASGRGVFGSSPTGIGVFGLSSSGTAGSFQILNDTNSSPALKASTGGSGAAASLTVANSLSTSTAVNITSDSLGSGITLQLSNAGNEARGIDVSQAGTGTGVYSSSTGGTGVWGISGSFGGAGVIGENTTGEAIVGRSQGDVGVGAVVGRSDGLGYGVRGFNTKTGIGVLGQTGISGGTGIGGRFENINAANGSDALQAATNGPGYAANFTASAAGGKGLSITTAGGPSLVAMGGNVGIGTTTPSAKLEVVDGGVRLTNTADSKHWDVNYDPSAHYFYVDEFGAARRMVVQNGGFVGLGTTTPEQQLALQGGLTIDNGNTNAGNIAVSSNNAITFGGQSGEGIASQRTGVGNVNGLDFYTNHTPRMSVTNGGSVGIGTTAPNTALDVNGHMTVRSGTIQNGGSAIAGISDLGLYSLISGNWLRLVTNGAPIQFFTDSTQGVSPSPVANSIAMTINTGNSPRLDVFGTVRANGSVLTSDIRFKSNIAPVSDALDTILNLRGVTFDWRRDGGLANRFPEGRQIGFIAQEVEKVLPDVVSTDADGYKSVAYQNIVPVLVEAVKTLKADNDSKTAQIAALKAEKDAQMQALEHRLSRLEELLARQAAGGRR